MPDSRTATPRNKEKNKGEATGKNDGASLACDSVICNETPDDEAEANCVNLGKALA